LEALEFKHLFTIRQEVRLNTKAGSFLENEFDEVYLVRRDIDISKLKLQKEEVAEVKWISAADLAKAVDEADKNFVPRPKGYIEKLISKT
jgi:isopentenyldiphosphate isomerase